MLAASVLSDRVLFCNDESIATLELVVAELRLAAERLRARDVGTAFVSGLVVVYQLLLARSF